MSDKFEEMYNSIMQNVGKIRERKLPVRHLAFEQNVKLNKNGIPEDEIVPPAPEKRNDGNDVSQGSVSFSRSRFYRNSGSDEGFGQEVQYDPSMKMVSFNVGDDKFLDLMRKGFDKITISADGQDFEFDASELRDVIVSDIQVTGSDQQDFLDDSEFQENDQKELQGFFDDEQDDIMNYMKEGLKASPEGNDDAEQMYDGIRKRRRGCRRT